MKKLLIATICVLFTLGAAAQKSTAAKSEKATFKVEMDCESCKVDIEKNVPFEKGIKDLSVDMAAGTVTVTFDPRKTSKADIAKAIGKLNLKVEEATGCCSEKKECAEKKACCGKKECTDKACADKKCSEKKECAEKKCETKKECCPTKK